MQSDNFKSVNYICTEPMNTFAALEWELGSRAAGGLLAEEFLGTVAIMIRGGAIDAPAAEMIMTDMEKYYVGKGITIAGEQDGSFETYLVIKVEDKDTLRCEAIWPADNDTDWLIPLDLIVDSWNYTKVAPHTPTTLVTRRDQWESFDEMWD